ncbi:MAG TPA: serine hydrolase [Candidatus Sulfotelmatobacter sp.]|nr:serine hydrolase [Candidatus Sulfotelmatobacter sp.]
MSTPQTKSSQFSTYRYSAPPKPPKKRRNIHWSLVWLVLILAIGIGAYFYHAKHVKAIKIPLTKIVISVPPKMPSGPSAAALGTMSSSINGVIGANSEIDTSVSLIDLNTGATEHYGVNQTFQAASTTKIITAEYFLHEVEAGQQSLSEKVGGNSAGYELQQMIVVSDDDAWEDLNEQLGYNNLQAYASSALGVTDYEAYNNSLSSGDIALALQKLWNGSLLNASDTQLLLSYLKQANYREYIVPAVPAQDTIYHKIGLYQDYVNDAAIITNGNKAFVIVIFTNGNGEYNWPARAIMMQTITKAALKAYFNQ